MKKLILYIVIASSIITSQDQLFVGTRPLGMGGAFIAVADEIQLPGIQLAFLDCGEKSLPLAMQIFTQWILHIHIQELYGLLVTALQLVLTGPMLGLTIRN